MTSTRRHPWFLRPAQPANWKAALLGFGIVESVGLLVRGLLLWAQPGVWYFPDSKSYIYALAYPRETASRPGDIAAFWFHLTFGNYHEHDVVVLQFILGMASIGFLYDGLRRITGKVGAIAWTSLYAALPIIAVYERTILSESLTIDFVVCFLWATCIAFSCRQWWLRPWFVVVGVASLAAAASIRTALLIPSIVAGLALGVSWMVLELIDKRSILRAATSVVALAASVVVFIAPLEGTLSQNQRVFSMRTLNVLSGSFLAARWNTILPCTSSLAKQSDVKAALRQLCHEHDTSQYPGFSMNLVWVPNTAIFQAGRLGPSLANDQRELSAITIAALISHPTAAIGGMTAVALDELFGPVFVNVAQYDDGYQMWVHQGTKQYRQVLLDWSQRSSAPRQNVLPVFRSIALQTSKIPQALLWLLIAGIVVRLVYFFVIVRRRDDVPVARDPWIAKSRFGIGVVASLFLVGNVIGIAATAFASFRYNLVLIAPLIVLLAMTWGRCPITGSQSASSDDVPLAPDSASPEGGNAIPELNLAAADCLAMKSKYSF